MHLYGDKKRKERSAGDRQAQIILGHVEDEAMRHDARSQVVSEDPYVRMGYKLRRVTHRTALASLSGCRSAHSYCGLTGDHAMAGCIRDTALLECIIQ